MAPLNIKFIAKLLGTLPLFLIVNRVCSYIALKKTRGYIFVAFVWTFALVVANFHLHPTAFIGKAFTGNFVRIKIVYSVISQVLGLEFLQLVTIILFIYTIRISFNIATKYTIHSSKNNGSANYCAILPFKGKVKNNPTFSFIPVLGSLIADPENFYYYYNPVSVQYSN